MLLVIASALLALNAMTAITFAIDKARARSGGWRISESTLLSLAAMGGSPAAYWARRRFRHKTRKQPFGARLNLIATVQAGIGAGLAIAWLT